MIARTLAAPVARPATTPPDLYPAAVTILAVLSLGAIVFLLATLEGLLTF